MVCSTRYYVLNVSSALFHFISIAHNKTTYNLIVTVNAIRDGCTPTLPTRDAISPLDFIKLHVL
jgi:hypothetical protein